MKGDGHRTHETIVFLHPGGQTESEGPFLDDLFHAIRKLPDEEHAAEVARRCGGDHELARELTEMLEAWRGNRSENLEKGRRLGRYELQRVLGSGATATVWQAWDTKLQRSVALKAFRRDLPKFGDLGAVLLEARATSHVVSDHIIRIQDVSETEDGAAFLVMELCAEIEPDTGALRVGVPMTETPAGSRDEVVAWMIGACSGVHAAHQQGVFHRDLKPDNVLIRPVSRRAQVTDFGLSIRRLEAHGGRDGRKTVTMELSGGEKLSIAGTPIFMAPEAARGVPADLDPDRDDHRRLLVGLDVYGLGATLYTLLAGRPPFQARPGADDPIRDILSQVRLHRPPPLARDTAWPVPPRLQRIVERAMHRDPRRRYRSAEALRLDLEAFREHRPSSMDQGRAGLATALWALRHWGLVGASASLGVMAVAALVSMAAVAHAWVQLDAARDAVADRDRAVAELERLEADADEIREAAAFAERQAHAANRTALELTLTLADTEDDLGTAGRILARTVRERDAIETVKRELEGEHEELATEFASLDDRYRALEARRNALQAEHDGLIADHAGLRRTLDQKLSDLERVQADLQTARADALDQRTRYEQERAARAVTEDTLTSVRTELDKANRESRRLDGRIDELTDRALSAEEQSVALRRDLNNALRQLRDLGYGP